MRHDQDATRLLWLYGCGQGQVVEHSDVVFDLRLLNLHAVLNRWRAMGTGKGLVADVRGSVLCVAGCCNEKRCGAKSEREATVHCF